MTRKQRAAALRNLKKARAARKRGKGRRKKSRRHCAPKVSHRAVRSLKRHLRAATKSAKHLL